MNPIHADNEPTRTPRATPQTHDPRPPTPDTRPQATFPGITAAFSTRHGGVSEAPYASLNLGLSTGDDSERVRENRRLFFERFGIRPEQLAIAGQVHGKKVMVVDGPGLYPGFDALVTATEKVALCITSADCAVVLLADPEARVVAACHSGWRGTVEEIVPLTLSTMERLDADPARIRAYIGPCISAEHFEVGAEVAAQFDDRYVVERPVWRRPHVDLKAVIRDQLLDAGVPPDAVEISDRCTFAETDDFYSYRAEGGKTGRMMGFIGLFP